MALNAGYMVRETTSNLTRNITLTVASILTVFVTLAIVGATVLVRQGVQNMTQEWAGGIEFIVYVDPDISDADLATVRRSLEDNPGVRRIEYVDRDATYADFRRLFEGQDTMLENVSKEDLPTSFKVEPTDKSVETVQELVRYYNKQPSVFEVRAATEVIRDIKGMTTFINTGLTVAAGLLLVASVLLILNTIRTAMFARRREIEVMKLVGATNWFIRIPFMLEGLVQGLLGGAFAVGTVFLLRNWLEDLLDRSGGLGLFRTFRVESGDVFQACVIVAVLAVVLSIVSSAIATRRFLDV